MLMSTTYKMLMSKYYNILLLLLITILLSGTSQYYSTPMAKIAGYETMESHYPCQKNVCKTPCRS